DLAGRPRGGRHDLLTTRAGTFSALHARRLGPRLPIAVLTAGRSARRSHRVVQDVPFALSWRLSRERTRFARAPLCRAFETAPGRPSGARPSAFAVSPAAGDAPPRMQGEPLEELRWTRSERNERALERAAPNPKDKSHERQENDANRRRRAANHRGREE